MLTEQICLFTLCDPGGAELPVVEAGAHVAVQTPSGAMRHYSLCGDPSDRRCYRLAIQREPNGRGGSRSMVDDVREGDLLPVGLPANGFALSDKARRFVFVAGGIGITPILSMLHALQQEGLRDFQLHYLSRTEAATPFLDLLRQPEFAGRVRCHWSEAAGRLDLWPLFEKPVAGTHVYCCGPNALMDEVQDMTGHWASGTVHFERFGADTKPHPQDQPFQVHLQRSQRDVTVDAQQSILEALRLHDVRVPSSCESGTCGSCKVRYLAGEVEHRDLVLLDEEKADCVMVCVSRAKGTLVLDL